MQLFAVQQKKILFTFSKLVLVFISTCFMCRRHFLGLSIFLANVNGLSGSL